MIGSLRGELLDRAPGGAELLVEVGGVGYRVQVTPSVAAGLELGRGVFLHVHHHVREDAETLYGFLTRDERDCFEALLSAHGVGPSLALAILGVHSPYDLRRAVADEDVGALCLVPGVGRKTAARLLVELSSRLGGALPSAPVPSTAAGGEASPRSDVREALLGLGYSVEEVRDVLRDLPEEGDSATLLREALQRLSLARA